MNKLNCMMMAGTLLVTADRKNRRRNRQTTRKSREWNHDHRSAHGIRQSKRSRSFS